MSRGWMLAAGLLILDILNAKDQDRKAAWAENALPCLPVPVCRWQSLRFHMVRESSRHAEPPTQDLIVGVLIAINTIATLADPSPLPSENWKACCMCDLRACSGQHCPLQSPLGSRIPERFCEDPAEVMMIRNEYLGYEVTWLNCSRDTEFEEG